MKKYCENRKCLEEVCPNCGIKFEKPISEINRNQKLGRKNFCSIACAVQYRENNESLTEKQKQTRENFKKKCTGLKGDLNPAHKRWDEFSPFRETLRKAKMHSRQTNKEFSLTLQDLKDQWEKQEGLCVYTNVKLTLPLYNNNPPLTEQASLDRIDSSKGYIPGNIQFVCSCINLLKNKLSDLEVKRFLKQISSFTSTFEEDQTISSSQKEMSDAQAGN